MPEADFTGRHEGPQHRYPTAGGALARQQAAGAQQSRALRALRVHAHDLRLMCVRGDGRQFEHARARFE
eukprot:2773791-Pyramimonas_sp.AAC.1